MTVSWSRRRWTITRRIGRGRCTTWVNESTTNDHGRISGHEGQWLVGEHGNRAGVFMPAAPRVGDVFEQERAPGVAEDRSRSALPVSRSPYPRGHSATASKPKTSTPSRRPPCEGLL